MTNDDDPDEMYFQTRSEYLFKVLFGIPPMCVGGEEIEDSWVCLVHFYSILSDES
jgi:hypothetical protein